VDVLQQLLDKYDAESKAREGKEKKEAKEGDMETRYACTCVYVCFDDCFLRPSLHFSPPYLVFRVIYSDHYLTPHILRSLPSLPSLSLSRLVLSLSKTGSKPS